ncbi:glycosyltransferase [Micromonospora sp. U56]|uniref:glycosyltransferase n=1 Tax=Micromonospora sp. U56 TaxID=2824900 RepID=UPI001B3872A7|nr:glycosyltransferase [Micromonospora sp. U56]MBQ0892909.1 glycosyltransferase [Micromonospora sp. U56]
MTGRAESAPLSVLMTYNFFEPGFRAGGPIRSIARLVDSCSEQVSVTLVTGDRDLGEATPYPGLSGTWIDRGRARVFYLDPRRPRHWWTLWRTVRARRFDLLYVNSLWSTYSLVPILAARLGLLRVPRVMIAPRGEFSPAALALGARRKRIFLRWWIHVLRRGRVEWHAGSQLEADAISRVLPWADVTVRANQAGLPAEPIPPDASGSEARLVFVGRISPMKNVDLLLTALTLTSAPIHLDLFGPAEDAVYWSRCQQLIDALPPTVRCTYHGPLAPDLVRETFAGYDAFAMPTRGENFGHVIAESLSASCPVVCSDRTPWSDVLHDGGGVVLRDLTAPALAAELERIARLSPEQRLRARRTAGAAYRRWAAARDDSNILDQVRVRFQGAGDPLRPSRKPARAHAPAAPHD